MNSRFEPLNACAKVGRVTPCAACWSLATSLATCQRRARSDAPYVEVRGEGNHFWQHPNLFMLRKKEQAESVHLGDARQLHLPWRRASHAHVQIKPERPGRGYA